MKSYLAAFVSASAAAITGFVIHVATQGWVQSWVASHMQGREVAPSWEVRYVALLTSLEVGVGLVILYALVRTALPAKSSLVRGLLLGVLLLAVMGRLIRQPAMNLVVGNPLVVVAVQDGISWLLWLSMCVVVAVTYDLLASKNAP
jgi:hypothetical protein